jgi:hypothetical protein
MHSIRLLEENAGLPLVLPWQSAIASSKRNSEELEKKDVAKQQSV